MFFEPRIWEKGQQIALSPCAVVEGEGYAAAVVQKLIAERSQKEGTVQTVRFCYCLGIYTFRSTPP